jgi:SWI/SNF-related matrix-associated actin-dependent regulator of chromatin subfamily A-like protein 1
VAIALSRLTDVDKALAFGAPDASQLDIPDGQRPTLDQAVQALAGMDLDGARVENEVGFNKLDTHFGRSMALLPLERWSFRQANAVYEMLRKYKGQLARNHGIFYDLISRPDASLWGKRAEHPSTISLVVRGNTPNFVFSFARSSAMLAKLRTIPGLRWDKEASTDSLSVWYCIANQDTAEKVFEIGTAEGFAFDDGSAALIEKQVHGFKAALVASEQSDSDPDPDLKLGAITPYRYQWAAYRYSREHAVHRNRVLIGDERGVGKTLPALMILEAEKAFPALIVAPNNVVYKWLREIQRALPHRTVMLIKGQQQIGLFERADIYVTNWESLSDGYDPKFYGKPVVTLKPAVNAIHLRGLEGVVFDESHKAKNSGAQRTIAAKQIAHDVSRPDGVRVRLCLTGTPMQNKVEEIWPQLEILGVEKEFGGWWEFRKHFCWVKVNMQNRPPEEIPELQELNAKLRGICMVRRLSKDVNKDKPALTRDVIPFEIDNRPEYERTLDDACRWFGERAVKDAEFLLSLAGLATEEREAAIKERATSAEMRAARARALATIRALKAVAVKGKMRQTIEWCKEFLDEESGYKSLVLFADHHEVQDQLLATFGGENPARILGGMNAYVRDQENLRFQDKGTRLAICSMMAASEGIDLTAAHDMMTVELGWNPGHHTQIEGRIDRNGQTAACTSYYPIAMDTIEEDIFDLIWHSKNRVVGLATDGGRFERFNGAEADEDSGDGIMASLTKRMVGTASRRRIITVDQQRIIDAAKALSFDEPDAVDGEFQEEETEIEDGFEANELTQPTEKALPLATGEALLEMDETTEASDGERALADESSVTLPECQMDMDGILLEATGFVF